MFLKHFRFFLGAVLFLPFLVSAINEIPVNVSVENQVGLSPEAAAADLIIAGAWLPRGSRGLDTTITVENVGLSPFEADGFSVEVGLLNGQGEIISFFSAPVPERSRTIPAGGSTSFDYYGNRFRFPPETNDAVLAERDARGLAVKLYFGNGVQDNEANNFWRTPGIPVINPDLTVSDVSFDRDTYTAGFTVENIGTVTVPSFTNPFSVDVSLLDAAGRVIRSHTVQIERTGTPSYYTGTIAPGGVMSAMVAGVSQGQPWDGMTAEDVYRVERVRARVRPSPAIGDTNANNNVLVARATGVVSRYIPVETPSTTAPENIQTAITTTDQALPAPEDISTAVTHDALDAVARNLLRMRGEDVDEKNVVSVEDPRVLPDNPFYVFKRGYRGIRMLFTFNTEKKAEIKIEIAQTKMIEAHALLLRGKTDLATVHLNESERDMEQARSYADKAKEQKPEDASTLENIIVASVSRAVYLDALSVSAPVSSQSTIDKLSKTSAESLAEVVAAASPESFGRAIKNAVANSEEKAIDTTAAVIRIAAEKVVELKPEQRTVVEEMIEDSIPDTLSDNPDQTNTDAPPAPPQSDSATSTTHATSTSWDNCTDDEYECHDWNPTCYPVSSTGSEGRQTRDCYLIFNCPNATTTPPEASRDCTVTQKPLCTAADWDCVAWSACDYVGPGTEQGQKNRTCILKNDCTPTPATTPKQTEDCSTGTACIADEWTCADWNACAWVGPGTEQGRKTRACTLVKDCPGVATPKPTETGDCSTPKPVPACTEADWNCHDYDSCSSLGTQSRECYKVNPNALCSGGYSPITSRACTRTPSTNPSTIQAIIPATGVFPRIQPTGIHIAYGGTVVLTNNDSVSHTVRLSFGNTVTIAAGANVNITVPNEEGTYYMYYDDQTQHTALIRVY